MPSITIMAMRDLAVGVAVRVICYPLDRAVLILQCRGELARLGLEAGAAGGALPVLRALLRTEGVTGLFHGCLVAVVTHDILHRLIQVLFVLKCAEREREKEEERKKNKKERRTRRCEERE